MMNPPSVPIVARTEYAVHHLVEHLAQAGRLDQIHLLLAMEDEQERNTWYTVKQSYGGVAGYIADVALIWRLVEELRLEAPATRTADLLGLQCRYALLTASVNSLAGNIPPALLVALTEGQIWTIDQALAYARQIRDHEQRGAALLALQSIVSGPQQNELIEEALAATSAIEDVYWRAGALASLAPQVPKALLPNLLAMVQAIRNVYIPRNSVTDPHIVVSGPPTEAALHAALMKLRTGASDMEKADELVRLARHMPKPLLQEALAVTATIQNEYERTMARSRLAPYLVAFGQQDEAVAIANEHTYNHRRRVALSRLIALESETPQTPELDKELERARAISDRQLRAEAIAYIATKCVEPQRGEVLQEAIVTIQTIADEEEQGGVVAQLALLMFDIQPSQKSLNAFRQITDEQWRGRALTLLAPHLPGGMLGDALELASALTDEVTRAETWIRLARYLPEPLLQALLGRARSIVDPYWRTRTVACVALQLPQPLRSEIGWELLVQLDDVSGDHRRADLVIASVPLIPDLPFVDTLALIDRVSDADEHDRALAALVAELGRRGGPAALMAVVTGILDAYWRQKAQEQLVVWLTGAGYYTEALAAAKLIVLDHRRAILLVQLAQHGQPTLQDEVIAAARSIEDAGWRATALAQLATTHPFLQDELCHEALDICLKIVDEQRRSEALILLADWLPLPQLQQALAAAGSIATQEYRDTATAALLPRLVRLHESADGMGTALLIADEHLRAVTLIRLLPHLRSSEKSVALRDALQAAAAIVIRGAHLEFMVEVVAQLDALDREDICYAWENLLYQSANQPRKDFLADLRTLLPMAKRLGERALLEHIALAVQDARRWWP
jgi:hypothetical protein